MSQGLKIGLIVAGAGVVGLFILRNASASALPSTTTPTATAPTGLAGFLSKLGIGSNGAPPPAGVAATPPTTALAPAPGAPTSSSTLSKVAGGLWSIDKSVVHGTISGAKTVVTGAIGVAGSAIHSIVSLF
jgi:hypothetical protein